MASKELGGDFFVIHFDVQESKLSLQTFIRSAQSIDKLSSELNNILFNNYLIFKIYVLPPEDGSFLKRLGIAVSAGAAAALSFAETDVGKAFIRGLTGHEPAYWAEQSGEFLRESLEVYTDEQSGGAQEEEEEEEEAIGNSYTCAQILSEATKGFLTSTQSELRKIGLDMNAYRKAYEGRNDLYEACISDNNIQAIGFTKEHKFPISRSKFPELYIKLPPPEDSMGLWLVEISELRITSPNWERKDQKRKWKGRDSKGNERYFVIEDESFWNHVELRDLKSNLIDKIKVQWAFREEDARATDYKVLRVIEYNDLQIGDPLSPAELELALGKYASHSEPKPRLEPNPRQTNLFGRGP